MSSVDPSGIVGTATGPVVISEIQDQFTNTDTELDARPEMAVAETITQIWTFELTQVFETGIDVTGSVEITTGDLLINETADHTATPAAGVGQYWVKSDAPCVPMFTDDAGNDFQLGQGDNSAVINNQTGATYTILSSDNGKVLTFSVTCAITLPDDLDTNFQCTIVQVGAGVPTVTPATDTINGAGTGVAPSAQWKGMYLTQYSATNWLALL